MKGFRTLGVVALAGGALVFAAPAVAYPVFDTGSSVKSPGAPGAVIQHTSGYTVASSQVLDGRSPDTLDAAQGLLGNVELQPVASSGSGFDWGDAGIGAGLASSLIGLLGAGSLGLVRIRRRVHTA